MRTIYAIYFPPSVTLTLGTDTSCDVFLAYHSSFSFGGVEAAFMAIGACGDAATLAMGDGAFRCTPGDAAIVRNLDCYDNAGYYATVRCNEGTNGFIDGSVQFDISTSCSNDSPTQNYESLVGDSNPTSKLTPLSFSASEAQPYAGTDPNTLCAANEMNNAPGSCSCPATSMSHDERHRALNVCWSGSNVGVVDPCLRQEIAADVSVVVVPTP